MSVRVFSSIEAIGKPAWDSLFGTTNPFLRFDFLCAIEKGGSLAHDNGWIANHLGLYQQNTLIGLLPCYEKHHSWGEFVFDFAWANAYQRYGFSYYPKLINAIPYTPASFNKAAILEGYEENVDQMLQAYINERLSSHKVSGFHQLFTAEPEPTSNQNTLHRQGCQFHWQNHGEANFDDFLTQLKAKKRKNIKQERNKANATGVEFEWLQGSDITEQDWHDFYQLYAKTNAEHGNIPFFTLTTMTLWGETLGEQVLLCVARENKQMQAAALFFKSNTTLYGRYWGCRQFVNSLHFEVCYYQGINYCIEHGLQRFEPGAQGEHKVARGFLPTKTYSTHIMADTPLLPALTNHVAEENRYTEQYIDALNQHSPYRT